MKRFRNHGGALSVLLGFLFLLPFSSCEDPNLTTVAENVETRPTTPLTEYSEDTQPPTSTLPTVRKNPGVKLKICEDVKRQDFKTDNSSVRIPTFAPKGKKDHKYVLEDYEIDWNDPLVQCPYGGAPLNSSEITLVTKTKYDVTSLSKSVLKILRSFDGHVLLDNGYLSVGDDKRNIVEYYSPDEYCLVSVNGTDNLASATFRLCPISPVKMVMLKCCPVGMVLSFGGCIGHDLAEKWDPLYLDVTTSKLLPISQVKPMYASPKLPCKIGQRITWEGDNCDLDFHPATNGSVGFIGAHRTWEYLNVNLGWCVDTNLTLTEKGVRRQRNILFYCVDNTTKQINISSSFFKEKTKDSRLTYVYLVSMYIGALFNFLTTLVYMVTWRKQNVHGKTLCSCTLSLFFMQTCLGTAHLLGVIKQERGTPFCIMNGIGGQYFMIAAFSWVLVVNFDLWRTFRRIRTEGGTELRRFIRYSLAGWGFPLLVSIISIILNFTFTCRNSGVPIPEFGEFYCFVAPWAEGYYVYYILGVLIALSFLFSFLTMFALYKFKKEAGKLRSSQRAADQQNVFLFLRLSVICGISWIFEVISWAVTKEGDSHVAWIVLDLYNTLSAVLIFFIFVCKRTQLLLLEQSVPQLKGLTSTLTKLCPSCCQESRSWEPENTASTNASNDRKWSITSQASSIVRFTKKRRGSNESNEGNTSKVSEQI